MLNYNYIVCIKIFYHMFNRNRYYNRFDSWISKYKSIGGQVDTRILNRPNNHNIYSLLIVSWSNIYVN